jgi:hypothetical protein
MKGIARGALALATMLLCLNFPAQAQQLPAVSAPNGKLEFDAGALTLPSPGFVGRAAGTVTLPLGDRFGLQADFSLSTASGFTGSTALHVFTRDPASYLIGGTLGYVRTPGANVVAAGPEAELYLGQWTLEAWGGVALSTPTAPASPSHVGVFGMGGVGYYPNDDWKLSLDVSSLDGYNAVELGSEYLLHNVDLPMSVMGTAHLGQDGAMRFMLGLRGYIGPDPDTSLIRRHREDDPSDRAVGLMTAVGDSSSHGAPARAGGSSSQEPEQSQNPPASNPPEQSSTPQYDQCMVLYNGDTEACAMYAGT